MFRLRCISVHFVTARCPHAPQMTVTSFRVGWNFSDGESVASAQDIFPTHGQLSALTLANSQAHLSTAKLHARPYIVPTHVRTFEDAPCDLNLILHTEVRASCLLHSWRSACAFRQVVLQSGTNESNWLAPAGGQFGFTFTGEESANPPDPSNPYRVAVLEVCDSQAVPADSSPCNRYGCSVHMLLLIVRSVRHMWMPGHGVQQSAVHFDDRRQLFAKPNATGMPATSASREMRSCAGAFALKTQ